jgi:hypothetical protein
VISVQQRQQKNVSGRVVRFLFGVALIVATPLGMYLTHHATSFTYDGRTDVVPCFCALAGLIFGCIFIGKALAGGKNSHH